MLLNCHTYYSLCYGTLPIDALLEEVRRKNYSSLVIADINNTSACLDAMRIASAQQLKVIPGIDFRNGIRQQYVGIAKNNTGFRELNEHLSHHLHSGQAFSPRAPHMQNAFIIYPAANYVGWELAENEFVGISLKDLKRLSFPGAKCSIRKIVALQTLTFTCKRDFNTHRLLRAISMNTLLSKLSVKEQASPDDAVPGHAEMLAAYQAYPELIRNTKMILEESGVDVGYGKLSNKNKKHFTGSFEEDMALLRNKCLEALPQRYPILTKKIMDRMDKELDVIGRLKFVSYYLINWHIVEFARSKKFYYVGRGSGANSLVAYLLRITDVDPIELDLYFERFINMARSNAPDFDIDFSWTDRGEITQYIFERFGKEYTALLGTYSTFQSDGVIRELGKVFGLPPTEIDQLQAAVDKPPGSELHKLVLQYSRLIHGFPSHLSVHSSGIVISEEPITSYTATFLPPKGFPTTQFSMLEAEDIGLYKLDILSQRGLSKIKDALSIIKTNKDVDIDIHDMKKLKNDPVVKALLSKGKCIGCFYIESPAMRMLLAKLQADDYLRLVAASSIIRPGVAKSGMMRTYILRYRDAEIRKKARDEMPVLYDLLEETYGVMVYQEDVIKVAHLFAKLSLEESDYLRRGMSWKFKQRNEFCKVREKFFSNCRDSGYPEKLITDIWTQIESFANFAFSKGHSASYAVESYQAMYLKAYYPLEYMVATLNNGGGFYRKEVYLHEARMHGATIEPPCINASDGLCVIRGTVIYLGLNMIMELEENFLSLILRERERNGAFSSLPDFVNRVSTGISQLRLLIRSGAFRFTGSKKHVLLWEAHSLLNPRTKILPAPRLFDTAPKSYNLPQLSVPALDEALDERELFGFFLRSPFSMLKKKPGGIMASEIKKFVGQIVEISGCFVTLKKTGTSTGETMYFGTFLDIKGDWIDTVHFPSSAKAYPFTGPGCYFLRGKVVVEFDFVCIEIAEMRRLENMTRDDAVEELV